MARSSPVSTFKREDFPALGALGHNLSVLGISKKRLHLFFPALVLFTQLFRIALKRNMLRVIQGRLDVGDLIKDTGSQSLYTLLYRPFQLFDGTP